ncbi:hypothetical protein TNCV_4061211 [Trichonephila clavipes]|nr:hypothetical protein TNCV_4061211 [Trichonephila clavipes]
MLERRIRQHNVSSKDLLKSVLKDQWEKISAEKTPRFASSMPKRLQEAQKCVELAIVSVWNVFDWTKIVVVANVLEVVDKSAL